MLDLTQAQMATAFGVTVNTWARWERGELAIHPAYQLFMDYLESSPIATSTEPPLACAHPAESAISGEPERPSLDHHPLPFSIHSTM